MRAKSFGLAHERLTGQFRDDPTRAPMPSHAWTYLFQKYDLRANLDELRRKATDSVANVPAGRIPQDREAIIQELVNQFRIERLAVFEDQIAMEPEEIQIDARLLRDRAVFDRSRPVYVPGMRITFYVPFTGLRDLWLAHPSTFTTNAPRAVLNDGELSFPHETADRDVERVRQEFQRNLSDIRQWMGWVNQQVDEYNAQLPQAIAQSLDARAERLAASQKDLSQLPYKTRQKPAPAPPAQPSAKANPQTVRRSKAPTARRDRGDILDVALSYASEQRPYVDAVAKRLMELGVSCFYDGDRTVELWGKDLVEHLAQVYATQARFVVMFISREYLDKAWPTHERRNALAASITKQGEYILPVRFDDTEAPGLATSIKYVDARTVSPERLADLISEKVRLAGEV